MVPSGLNQVRYLDHASWWWVLGYSRKNPKKGWVDDIYTFLKKNPWNLYICHFTLREKASTLGNSTDLCYNPLKFQDQKFFSSSLLENPLF